MIKYYINKQTDCIYVYNTQTGHWIIKSPKILGNLEKSTLDSLNQSSSGVGMANLVSIGRLKAVEKLNKQYHNIKDTWEYNGEKFACGDNLQMGSPDYFILYYLGKTYPVRYYITSTDTYVLREGKYGRISVSAKYCAPIFKITKTGEMVAYGKTIIKK